VEEEEVSVIRVLEIRGPKPWVENVLRRSWVQPEKHYEWGNQSITELLRSTPRKV
jgi:hypothetical protein